MVGNKRSGRNKSPETIAQFDNLLRQYLTPIGVNAKGEELRGADLEVVLLFIKRHRWLKTKQSD